MEVSRFNLLECISQKGQRDLRNDTGILSHEWNIHNDIKKRKHVHKNVTVLQNYVAMCKCS
jgi:hypothetical protein